MLCWHTLKVFRAREVRRLEHNDQCDKEMVNNMIGMPLETHRVQRESIAKQDVGAHGATPECSGCNAIKDEKRPHTPSERCRNRIDAKRKVTPQGTDRVESPTVINEALAKELQRYHKRNSDSEMTAPASASQHEEEESPVALDPDVKRRIFTKSSPLMHPATHQRAAAERKAPAL